MSTSFTDGINGINNGHKPGQSRLADERDWQCPEKWSFQMETILMVVGRILDSADKSQLEMLHNQLVSFYNGILDEKMNTEFGFTPAEIAMFRPHESFPHTYHKVPGIKAYRERTGKSLVEAVEQAKKLFAARGWKW